MAEFRRQSRVQWPECVFPLLPLTLQRSVLKKGPLALIDGFAVAPRPAGRERGKSRALQYGLPARKSGPKIFRSQNRRGWCAVLPIPLVGFGSRLRSGPFSRRVALDNRGPSRALSGLSA